MAERMMISDGRRSIGSQCVIANGQAVCRDCSFHHTCIDYPPDRCENCGSGNLEISGTFLGQENGNGKAPAPTVMPGTLPVFGFAKIMQVQEPNRSPSTAVVTPVLTSLVIDGLGALLGGLLTVFGKNMELKIIGGIGLVGFVGSALTKILPLAAGEGKEEPKELG